MEIIKSTFCTILDSLSQKAKRNFDIFCSEIQRVASEYNLLSKITNLELVCSGNTYEGMRVSLAKVKPKGKDKTYVFFASCSLLTAEKETLAKTVQHELMHIKDMEDVEFKYSEKLWEESQKDKRLSTLIIIVWNIYVDSRISKMGKSSITKEERLERLFDENQEFDLGLDPSEIEDIFESLWSIEKIDFPNIINKAKELLN